MELFSMVRQLTVAFIRWITLEYYFVYWYKHGFTYCNLLLICILNYNSKLCRVTTLPTIEFGMLPLPNMIPVARKSTFGFPTKSDSSQDVHLP